MTMFSKIIVLSWWLLFIASRFTHVGLYHLIYWWSIKANDTKELEQLKHMSTKIQEVTSYVIITEKNEKTMS